MFFEIIAVLAVTFFASLGMIEASQWLINQSVKCRMKKNVIFIADAASVSADGLEEAVRTALSEADPIHGRVILDCRKTDSEAREICRNLCLRFNCTAAESEKDLFTEVFGGLQIDKKDI